MNTTATDLEPYRQRWEQSLKLYFGPGKVEEFQEVVRAFLHYVELRQAEGFEN